MYHGLVNEEAIGQLSPSDEAVGDARQLFKHFSVVIVDNCSDDSCLTTEFTYFFSIFSGICRIVVPTGYVLRLFPLVDVGQLQTRHRLQCLHILP